MSHSILAASFYRAITLMVVALFYCGEASAKGYAPAAFFGLKGINVVVENVGRDAETAGLTRERIETIVALRLRKAGIPLLKSSTEEQGNPYLYVRVSALRIEDSTLFIYSVQVQLHQHVQLKRESPFIKGRPAWVASATTGSDETMGYAGRAVFVNVVTTSVEEFIDKFALAYLNSKDLEKSRSQDKSKAQDNSEDTEMPEDIEKSSRQPVQL
jgi:hypothetical protein